MNDSVSESASEACKSPPVEEKEEKKAVPGVVSISQIDIADFMNVDLRIAEVTAAEEIPKSKNNTSVVQF